MKPVLFLRPPTARCCWKPSGWQSHALPDGAGLRRLSADMARPTLALGVLGNSGFAAYVGLLDIVKVSAGETVIVAAATGPVGATVVQLAKPKGARVVAIAGGADKVAYARDTLGADGAIDHREREVAGRIAAAAPTAPTSISKMSAARC